MDYFNTQKWNFALYNGLGAALAVVFILYSIFLWRKYRANEVDWAFEFGIGIWLTVLSRFIERIYYGTLRAFDIKQGSVGVVLSSEIIIILVAVLGICGLVWHIKTLTKSSHFGKNIVKGVLWVVLGVISGSYLWALFAQG